MRHRLAQILSETPVLFFALVLGIALVFKVAIGWAKTPTTLSEDPAAKPMATSAAGAASPADHSAAATATTATTTATPALATPEPVPSVPAPSMLPRKKPRPRR